MRTIERTSKKITIEATQMEIDKKGFDVLWDEIREIYPETVYSIESVEPSYDVKIIIIKLRFKKSLF